MVRSGKYWKGHRSSMFGRSLRTCQRWCWWRCNRSWDPSQETSSSWPVQGLGWKAVKCLGWKLWAVTKYNILDLDLNFQWPLSHTLKFKTFRISLISFWFKWNSKIVTNQIQSSWWEMTTGHTWGNQTFSFHYLWEVLNPVISWSRACTAGAVLQPHLHCKDWLYSSPSTPKWHCFHTPQVSSWQTGKIPKKNPTIM